MFDVVAKFQNKPVLRVYVPRFGSMKEAVSLLPDSTVEAIFDIENGNTFSANNMSEIYEAARLLEDVKV